VKHALASGARPVAGASASVADSICCRGRRSTFAKFGEIEEKPLSRIQKISGANLARNWAMIPHVTQHEDADITELEASARSSAKRTRIKVTPLVFQIKAVVAALKQFPQFNASLDETARS
jgi:Pyruvate/2-oxoglutarate dehydrogenase complex, dihydrolipoamide acyltransferase (E2) component, and related enzymes